MKKYPSQERLKELFDYHPDGYLVWKSGRRAGKAAGCTWVDKRLSIHKEIIINNEKYSYKKILQIYKNGQCQDGELYQDSNRSHHSPVNGSSVDFKGVHKYKSSVGDFYISQASIDGSNHYLGMFLTAEAAAAAYDYFYLKLKGDASRINGVLCDFEKFRISHGEIKKKLKPRCKSGFKGVYKNHEKWMVRVGFEGRNIYVGTFENIEEAARAYNCKAVELFGVGCFLNDIPDPLGKGDIF